MELKRVNRQDLRRLAQKGVVTTKDLSEIFDVSPLRARDLAYYLKVRGFLTHVARGLYACVPLDVDPNGFTPDSFLVVRKVLDQDCAFSHFSALALLGFEQTVRKTIHVTAPGVRARRRRIGSIPVHVHSTRRVGWKDATTTVRRAGESLRVTTPERTLVDMASLPNSMQDYETDVEAFMSLLPRADPEKLRHEILVSPSVTVRARCGHLIGVVESRDSQWSETLSAIQESVKSMSPIYFATKPHSPNNTFDRGFRVIYPGRT
jgi:predicted transcriptional regulator of viral defense system